MIGVSFWRVARAALQNFWRNIWLSAATTIIMTITLVMVMFLYFANVFGVQVLDSIEQKIDLSVTFKEETQPEFIDAIKQELLTRDDVQTVTVITSEEALQIFRERHSDNPLIEESLQELGDNPLPASLFVVAEDPAAYAGLAEDLSSEKYADFIDEVNFESTRQVIDRLIGLITSVKNVGLVVTVLFAILVVLIMYNTIRLAIYSFREEIEIMRLVGASRWFVAGPFVIEGIVVAILGVILATSITYPSLSAAAPHLQRFFFDSSGEQFNLYDYATNNLLTIVSLQVGVAVVLAVFSSSIAIRRYLRD